MVHSTMDGHAVMVSRFATTLRRQLYKGEREKAEHQPFLLQSSKPLYRSPEHLGLIPPQFCDSRHENVTPSMRCAPYPIQDAFGTPEDDVVADPLCDETWELWTGTAKRNRDIFTELFRPVPTNLVRDWGAYDVR
jgi:phospholipase D1/2